MWYKHIILQYGDNIVSRLRPNFLLLFVMMRTVLKESEECFTTVIVVYICITIFFQTYYINVVHLVIVIEVRIIYCNPLYNVIIIKYQSQCHSYFSIACQIKTTEAKGLLNEITITMLLHLVIPNVSVYFKNATLQNIVVFWHMYTRNA